MSAQGQLLVVRQRRVFARVKGVELDVSKDPTVEVLKPHVFELRRDGVWFRRKHSPKWLHVGFAGLLAEARRQEAEAKLAADAKREDPRQMLMFVPAERRDEQRSLL